MEEIEVKFLDIDVAEIRKKLKSLGAKKTFEKLYRRKMFDYPDWRLDKKGAWLRVRDEGDQVMLVYKQRLGEKLDEKGKTNDLGMEEIELEIENFDKAALIFEKIGFITKRYMENRRERWELDGVTFDLDTYPMIPTYLEIEADDWEKIDETIAKLGLKADEKKIFSVTQIYRARGIEENEYDVITFEKQIKKRL